MAAIEQAFLGAEQGAVTDSASLGLSVPGGTFHAKACASIEGVFGRLFVAKINSNFPDNPARHGLPTIQGVIAAFDAGDGRLIALVDSPSITNLRTAATSAVAIRLLARADAHVAAIIGCGVQGTAHAEVLEACMALRELRLYDTDIARARTLAAKSPGIETVIASSVREAALAADVVITCTPSLQPILGRADVKPGTLVVAVGADNERKKEIDPDLLAASRIVADHRAQAQRSGDSKQLADAPICGDLGDVVAGRIARASSGEIVLFDSTGLALQDLALCSLVLRMRSPCE